MVNRIFVEKKDGFDVAARDLLRDLTDNLKIQGLTHVRLLVRYDVEGITKDQYEQAKHTIFSEPQVDVCYDEQMPFAADDRLFAIEYLPGQYDQRADFASQCLQIITQGDRPLVRAARVVVLEGDVTEEQFQQIKQYCINPVEAHEASMDKPEDLHMKYEVPGKTPVLDGFVSHDEAQLQELLRELGLAMDLSDVLFCQQYFRDTEHRDPTLTEIRMIDTYWSDHCRHTTFMTKLEEVTFEDQLVQSVFDHYLAVRQEVYGDRRKNICLMDVATIATKKLKKDGKLSNLDESEEINACSIEVEVDVNGVKEPWLVMFKNETHNHPTEIEPFGGAATCLGGAIRDPLSGRVYVYQAMRVTGSGDPRKTVEETIKGKLPQRKISTTAAAGYSSYGNQIGLATGLVTEVYHEGYVAKRMEIGAVVGAAPKANVVRERPEDGDVIILLGGRTGRDGCGGATGSSKAHTEDSLASCGAEVQKGNPPEERKLQRLFRNPQVTHLIKRCNDFGAGGVSVAIGELADGLVIDLDRVPKKYEGLTGTELAISESQERMAVVVRGTDEQAFIQLAQAENLEATKVAEVNDSNRLIMLWNGDKIVDISRDFLNTNGAEKQTTVLVKAPGPCDLFQPATAPWQSKWKERLADLNVCSQKGLVERFDASIGGGSVLMPFGGKTQLSPTQAMAAKIPVSGETKMGTVMAYGYHPQLSTWSPFHGAVYAVVESVAKLVAAGGALKDTYLTLQEYFERLGTDAARWGKPLSALLGAYHAQLNLGIAAIGGKDSMSGSFLDIDVPPTLVSFAISPVHTDHVVSTEFKQANSRVVLVQAKMDEQQMPDFEELKQLYGQITQLIGQGKVRAAFAVTGGGLCEALSKMSFGNQIGINLTNQKVDYFAPSFGSIVLELADDTQIGELLGTTTDTPAIAFDGQTLPLDELTALWQQPLEGVFPTHTDGDTKRAPAYSHTGRNVAKPAILTQKPMVFIPVFPGTNCEYDTVRAFEQAGANTDVFVFRNLNANEVEQSVEQMSKRIAQAQMVMLSGGFSAGDEPDGSGKFIATTFRNPRLQADIHDLLYKRDGLMLGICNGFQALIKLGLVPFGRITQMDATCPTLTYNTIGRHVSTMVNTRIASTLSPWLANVKVDDVHAIAVSHGEGRFVADADTIAQLAEKGQIATQYVDDSGNPTYDIRFNPNGSMAAIEGITSPDGRVFGKMGHSERIGDNVYKNIIGAKDQMIFRSGVEYFK